MGSPAGRAPADDHVLYLDNEAVLAYLAGVDVVTVVAGVLAAHRDGRTVLPEEAALYWPTPAGATARSLALPALVEGPGRPVAGLKVINANPANVARGLPRASGILVLFDPETARVTAVLQAEHISSRRTAAVTAVAVRHLAPGARSLSLIGCGALARAHLDVCPAELAGLDTLTLFDLDRGRAEALAAEARRRPDLAGVEVAVAPGARAAVEGSEVVIPVTTVTEPYITSDWLSGTRLVVNVSLDDCARDVFQHCDLLVVDDWDLVAADTRRLLGVLAAEGAVTPPGSPAGGGGRPVDATLGDVVASGPGRSNGELVVVNPFGMGVHDVALGGEVLARATRGGRGGLRLSR
jgi:ornithine cyclodeaminase